MWDIKKMKKTLNSSKKDIKLLDDRFKLLEIDLKYKKLCSGFSKAYLSGSYWYVGDSLTEYIKNLNIRDLINNHKLKFIYSILSKEESINNM